jgi:hypothetical protein
MNADFVNSNKENCCSPQYATSQRNETKAHYLNDIIKLTAFRNYIIRFKTTAAQRAIWSNFDTSNLRRILCSFLLNLVHC